MIESIIGVTFDCPNANELADFYGKLTGWKKELAGEEWAALRTPEGMLFVFQTVEHYVMPVWPWKSGEQQQMAHLDFKVNHLREAEELALKCGAKKSDVQFFDTSTVLFDPAGHPFCLSTISQ